MSRISSFIQQRYLRRGFSKQRFEVGTVRFPLLSRPQYTTFHGKGGTLASTDLADQMRLGVPENCLLRSKVLLPGATPCVWRRERGGGKTWLILGYYRISPQPVAFRTRWDSWVALPAAPNFWACLLPLTFPCPVWGMMGSWFRLLSFIGEATGLLHWVPSMAATLAFFWERGEPEIWGAGLW